jgi:hypothetical protein
MSPNQTIGIAIQGAGTVSTGHLRAYLKDSRCQAMVLGSWT